MVCPFNSKAMGIAEAVMSEASQVFGFVCLCIINVGEERTNR